MRPEHAKRAGYVPGVGDLYAIEHHYGDLTLWEIHQEETGRRLGTVWKHVDYLLGIDTYGDRYPAKDLILAAQGLASAWKEHPESMPDVEPDVDPPSAEFLAWEQEQVRKRAEITARMIASGRLRERR